MTTLPTPNLPPGSRIAVAMSGGVDSSLTAAMLARQGFDVIGLTLQLAPDTKTTPRKGACCAGQDIHDARRLAEKISIPHYVLNHQKQFRRDVMDDFAESYLNGETPLPCVRCNQKVKFRDLLETAKTLGARALATGHYARLRHTPHGPELHQAADATRDQSYFLFATTRRQLEFLRFPLGDITKSHARDLARSLNLANADKPDSQDICFVPDGRYAEIIKKLRPDAATPGDILHKDGRILGRHDGIINFTIGQRRRLGVSAPDPLYVLAINAEKHQIIVGPQEALAVNRLALNHVNWIAPTAFSDLAEQKESLDIRVRVRSSGDLLPATLFPRDNLCADVRLRTGEPAIAPGQACVFHHPSSRQILGGGWIKKTAHDSPREAP